MLLINLTALTQTLLSDSQRCFHSPPGRKHWIFHLISGRGKTTLITSGPRHSCYNCFRSWCHFELLLILPLRDFQEWHADRNKMEKNIETPWHLPNLSRNAHALGCILQDYAAPSPTGGSRWDQCSRPALEEKHFPLQSRAELPVPLDKDFNHNKGQKNKQKTTKQKPATVFIRDLEVFCEIFSSFLLNSKPMSR